jgi:hypothetical protein
VIVLVGFLDSVGLACFVAIVALATATIDRRFRCRP